MVSAGFVKNGTVFVTVSRTVKKEKNWTFTERVLNF